MEVLIFKLFLRLRELRVTGSNEKAITMTKLVRRMRYLPAQILFGGSTHTHSTHVRLRYAGW